MFETGYFEFVKGASYIHGLPKKDRMNILTDITNDSNRLPLKVYDMLYVNNKAQTLLEEMYSVDSLVPDQARSFACTTISAVSTIGCLSS